MMEIIIWVFVVLLILGDAISRNENKALKLGFVIMTSSLLSALLLTVNDMIVVKAAIDAVKAAPGLVEAWKGFAGAWKDIKFYYNKEKKAQA